MTEGPASETVEISLAAKRAFLGRPESYPERPRKVESVDTHMACVFLTDRFAYKLKKPVEFPFLDYRSLEARRRMCEEEVRLNRRLAPDVYLGTVALTREPRGGLALDGTGEAVDWLVKMRRLPEGKMLDRLIRRGDVRRDDLRRLGEKLGDFYASAPAVPTSPAAYRGRLRERIREDRAALGAPEFQLSTNRVKRIVEGLLAFVQRRSDLLDHRVRRGLIVEGHGDLRPQHVCLEAEPVVIDCIEFKREYRIVDPIDDLAFLGLECERLGAAWVGDTVLESYVRTTGDRPPEDLVAFYRGARALLRAKLSISHLRDDDLEDPDRWRELTQRYLQTAGRPIPVH